jgi:Zn-dependent alcohol dehydrogenase
LLVLRAVAPEGLVIVVDPIADRQRIAETLGAQAAVAPEAAASAVHDVSRGLGADGRGSTPLAGLRCSGTLSR